MSTSFDPNAYKAIQRQSWGAESAGWLKWADAQERDTRPVTMCLLQMARISPGQNVLDVASGAGDPSIAAALHVGPSGSVLATDQSPEMLDAARTRASDFGLDNMSFQVTDAELLNLPTQSFDAALCRWGLMFMPNLPGVLGRIHDILANGGRFATAVWSVPDRVPMLSLPNKALGTLFDIPRPPEGAPGPFSLADGDALADAFTLAGFENVRIEKVNAVFQASSAESFVEFVLDLSAPLAILLADKSDEVKSQARNAIAEEVKYYAKADGHIEMPNEAICIVGEK